MGRGEVRAVVENISGKARMSRSRKKEVQAEKFFCKMGSFLSTKDPPEYKGAETDGQTQALDRA